MRVCAKYVGAKYHVILVCGQRATRVIGITDPTPAQTVHLTIDPQDVRLHPRDTDLYVWKYLPERAHLFTKPISKHNAGAYREICRELGNSMEVLGKPVAGCDAGMSFGPLAQVDAISEAEQRHSTAILIEQNDHSSPTTTRITDVSSSSFTQTITHLQSLNQQLSSQLSIAQAQLDAQSSRLAQLQTQAESATTQVRHLETTLQETQSEAAQVRHDHEQQHVRVMELEEWIRGWQASVQPLQESAHLKLADALTYTSLLEHELVC